MTLRQKQVAEGMRIKTIKLQVLFLTWSLGNDQAVSHKVHYSSAGFF